MRATNQPPFINNPIRHCLHLNFGMVIKSHLIHYLTALAQNTIQTNFESAWQLALSMQITLEVTILDN